MISQTVGNPDGGQLEPLRTPQWNRRWMTSKTSRDLASLLCSRLCHDLLSPVGALTNGLELLAEERDPEMRQR